MKGSSKVIMGATLVLAVSLAMVLVLILVLLAELYCSLLLRRRRRRLRTTASNTATPTSIPTAIATSSPLRDQSSSRHDHDRRDVIPPATTTPLSSFYSPGVLQAPRSLLFPVVSSAEKQSLSELHPHQLVIDIPKQMTEPAQEQEEAISSCGNNNDKHFVYISNPIYENLAVEERLSTGPNTPFETPDSSPSRLEEMAGSESSSPLTPPLTPMKKLPAEASSVSLGDGRSLGTESDSNNGLSNSSSSATPCTSPSW